MSRNFCIVTDTGNDLPQEYYVENGIFYASLNYILDDVVYGDGLSMSEEEFYQRMRQGAMPITSQINPATAESHIRPLVEAGNDVLVLTFSSGLSGTCNSFKIAAKELSEEYPDRKITVVDSLCASLGQGLLLDYVVKKADTGASIEETAAYAEDLKLKICHQFTVDDLFHLKRGGRVSAVTATVGTMLRVKPLLHVDNEGHLIKVSQVVGRKKSVTALADAMSGLADLSDEDPVFISHADCLTDALTLEAEIRRRFGQYRRVFIHSIGPVIGAHAGAGTLALFFKGKHR